MAVRGGTVAAMADPLDKDVTDLARRIAELGAAEKSSVFRMSWWSDTMLDWAMSKPGFKTELFRFVDVFPALTDNADVLRHVDEYFEGSDVPKLLNVGIGAADKVPGGKSIAASVARRNIMRMAHQFIAGTTPSEAVASLEALWTSGQRVHLRPARREDDHRRGGRALRRTGSSTC